MRDLIINNNGLIANSLATRLVASDHTLDSLPLNLTPNGSDEMRKHFENASDMGRYYQNIFINTIDGFDEINAFTEDPLTAINDIESKICELLKAMRYGCQHLSRSNGGGIWVICMDHSVEFSLACGANPVINNALIAAVRSLAKEVHRFEISVNVFLVHPPKEQFDNEIWRGSKNNMKIYAMKYRPQPVDSICRVIHMYSELGNSHTSGVVIPVGTGIIEHNI